MKYARLVPETEAVETFLDLDPEYVSDLPPAKSRLLRPVVVDEMPEPDAAHVVESANYVVEADRVRQTWTLREKTPDELRITVTPRQIRQALNAAGLRQQIEAGVTAADQDTKDWWEFATSFESDHPMVIGMCQALGVSDEQRAQVFQLAATL